MAALLALAVLVFGRSGHSDVGHEQRPSSPAPTAPQPAVAAPAPTPSALLAAVAAPEHFSISSFPFLPGEQPRAVSIGDASTGRLVDGVRLEESEHLGLLPQQQSRDYRYGTSELVGALQHAARELHRQTGTKLWVGHLSKHGGGNIPQSVSHNSGRDADLALCYQDKAGAPIEPDDLIGVFGDHRTTRTGVYFDVHRTWLVVKALITYEGAQVQYLFLSWTLEKRLLAHALAIGESRAVRGRATLLLHQPVPGAAHHDHLHLRLFCSEADVLAGCRNTGKKHAFAKLFRLERARFAKRLAAHLEDADAEVRRRALERIALLNVKLLGHEVASCLGDPSPTVQRAAAMTLARFGGKSHLRLARRWLRALDPPDRLRAAERLEQVADRFGVRGQSRFWQISLPQRKAAPEPPPVSQVLGR